MVRADPEERYCRITGAHDRIRTQLKEQDCVAIQRPRFLHLFKGGLDQASAGELNGPQEKTIFAGLAECPGQHVSGPERPHCRSQAR
jgi:hypothetical protein